MDFEASEAEVGELGGEGVVEENVGGFDVAVDDGGVEGVEVVDGTCDVEDDVEAVLPGGEVGGSVAEEGVVEVAVGHELVDEEEAAAFGVGGEADGGDHQGGAEAGGQEELVVELALALEGGGVHQLDGHGLPAQGAGEDGAEAALAQARGEGVGGPAEERVWVGMRRVRVGVGGGSGALSLAEAEQD